ncbi:MAG: hypothetical protein ACLFRG_22810 [Desulfococcaceae bacterium]
MDHMEIALREIREVNPNRNDAEAYIEALIAWALGEEDRPEPADYGLNKP